ncbi:sporulation kinase E [Desulfosporosinus acididurans]|uniref:histidine kinase n=1 Tax=Desulfosporosinus acididurans TaxID=476652 RepID=A0A0J1FUC6_9FIRM|nr:PAS domain S-box protein [Desulfosporosinus acididurans]KLU66922.1 sporulation kinase E [Desulfosporosinus acididurans]
MHKNIDLRAKILLSLGIITLLSFVIITYILSMESSEMAKDSAYQSAEESAEENGTYVKANLDFAMDTARTLSYTFQQVRLTHHPDRVVMGRILAKVLQDNPQFTAVWTLWEPNALDGMDADYKNKPGYDGTGRFIPYYSNQNGKIHLEPLVNYGTPGAGDYYLIPKRTNKETVIEPCCYPIMGKNVMITRVVVPIMIEGTFDGVVGIDISSETFQKAITSAGPLERGYISLLSNDGRVVASSNPSKIGAAVEDSSAKEAIKQGKRFSTMNKDSYEIYKPITIGRTTTPWSMSVHVPMGLILEEATKKRREIVVHGIIWTAVISLILFFVESRITNQHLKKEIKERQAFQERILRLASIVESTDEGIIGLSLEGIILDWNRGAERIYGYTKQEIIGKTIKGLIPQDRMQEFGDIIWNVSHGISVTNSETQRIKKDGQLIYVYLTVSPIKNQRGEIIGMSTIVRDITTQKILEKEMTRMEHMNLIGEMAASIGHEVRNPMTTVRGFLQLLEANPTSEHYRNYIPLMISELDRANSIITEFLSISRTKATEFARGNLNDILESIRPLLEVDAIREDKLVVLEKGEVPDLLLNDKEIRQLIINLSRNGLEAMKEGGHLIDPR